MTTHISWVFLTDRDVWKLKRPVDYGFVDYTTLARRGRCCEDEVRLNRRLAPDVYLGVVRSGSVPGPRVGADGEIVDYAVRMPMARGSAQRGPHRSARTRSTPDHRRRLAGGLGQFFSGVRSELVPGAVELHPATLSFQPRCRRGTFVARFVARRRRCVG